MSKRIPFVLWNLVVIISTSYFAVFTPINSVVDLHAHTIFQKLSYAANIILLLDLIFNLYRYKYRETELLFETKSNLSYYMTRWFVFDLIPVIPFYLFDVHIILKLLVLFKLIKIAYYFRVVKINEIEYSNFFTMGFFIYWISHFAHWIACGWLYLRGIDPSLSLFDNYVKSLYWTITTITTVGYGDITPVNTIQIFYALFVELVGVGTYGYLIGKIASFLGKRDPAKNRYINNLENLSSLVRLRDIPPGLQKRIRDYYTYVFKHKSGFDESKFIEGLPESLQKELSIALKKTTLQKIPLFKDAESEFIQEVAMHLKPVIFTPGDYVFREGDEGHNVYFVIKGELEVISEKENKIIGVLRNGDFFGEIALFKNVPRTATIKAVDYCDLYTLTKARFDYALSKFPGLSKLIKEKIASRQSL
ncbi:MAG: cyclic nucleotide-binding domain-containing protein [Melioribacteraceae bacterium]|nr:cyclic nucleotide-binding domain-containing protein [Melioribacteraceae bacterium]